MNPSESTRAWLYRIGLACFVVLFAVDVVIRIGLVDAEPVGILDTIAPLLGLGATGLAARNTSVRKDKASQ